MLNDTSAEEDESRVGSPPEPKEPRFSVMPDTSQEKQEVIEKCLNGGYVSFMTMMGEHADVNFMVQLQINLPRFSHKRASKYTLEQAETCINFAIQMNKLLEKSVDAMDLGDINDLFLEES